MADALGLEFIKHFHEVTVHLEAEGPWLLHVDCHSSHINLPLIQFARAHDINANQVFAWRKLYREGRMEIPQGSSALVPVKITDELRRLALSAHRKTKPIGVIDIDLGHARIRIEGAADPDCVRAAVEGLTR